MRIIHERSGVRPFRWEWRCMNSGWWDHASRTYKGKKFSTNTGKLSGCDVNFQKKEGLDHLRIFPDSESENLKAIDATLEKLSKEIKDAQNERSRYLAEVYANAEPLTFERLREEIAKLAVAP